MNRSERLLRAGARSLEQATSMRFACDVHHGTIGDPEYARYLEFEAEFVDTAARLHGLAAWQAPHWQAVTRNAAALHGLTTEQTEYFAAARAAWPVGAEVSETARRAASELSEYALATAEEGGYAAVTTVMFAAETLYLTWCTRALRDGTPPDGPVADWVELHTREPFTAGVAALGAAVDELPAHIPDDRLIGWFTGMLDAEIAFHDAVYQ